MIENATKFELRELNATDIFAVSRIIKKIGVASFKKCFESDAVKEMIAQMSDEEKKTDAGVTKIGASVALEIVDVLFARLPECEQELYSFLASVSGMKIADVQKLSMIDFFELVIAVIKKPEFADFFKAASSLLK